MKFNRSIALGFASMALAVSATTAPASADAPRTATDPRVEAITTMDGTEVGQVTHHKRGDGTQPPAELGDPEEWGVVTIEMDDSTMRPMVENCDNPPSGGKWCYGWYLTEAGTKKYCYSNYYHGTKTHKSSVTIGNGSSSSGWVGKGEYANANRTVGMTYVCKTYYATK
ncbi:lactococcin 972 family bacteriocin [Streptomyces koyangensis]|uniref:lactococcin 972 family bacteriocin n=1 Tax=Streptomyces koyangensis TaxID=188770 RepID=UPI00364661AF|nr:lactococcin 972 family bacteriocin [Streptomyces albidoflavus]